jgi:hypothetical protein
MHRYSDPEHLIAERERVAFDLANIEAAIRNVRALAAAHKITRDQAETVTAQRSEEHRQLTDRLKMIDGSLAVCSRRT